MGSPMKFVNPLGGPVVTGRGMAAYTANGGGGVWGGQLFWGGAGAVAHCATETAGGCIKVTLLAARQSLPVCLNFHPQSCHLLTYSSDPRVH